MTPLEALMHKDRYTSSLRSSTTVASNGVTPLKRSLPTRNDILVMNSLLTNALTG